ncbi:Zinc finger CCCH domain-containing protein 19 [Morus notabilis]|uniref:Zinc finger CCCH domain-containing protein 19 n=1 Tax=Morus notabilis TaxID=981085 RepID=W9QGZ0_9ROSA|nr:Zinc finger CCCH domain-containing protein 19 [Morus notabilis]
MLGRRRGGEYFPNPHPATNWGLDFVPIRIPNNCPPSPLCSGRGYVPMGIIPIPNRELRPECVEKLQLLKTPEERKRRLEEIPEIHADPNMDPSFESEEEEETDDKRQENFMRSRGSAFGRRGREPISPRIGGSALSDTWSGTRNYSSMNQELSRSMSSRVFSNKLEDTTGVGEIVTESWNLGRDREMQPPNSWEKHKMSTLEAGSRSAQSGVISESLPAAVSENSGGTGVAEPAAQINESEKIWHYKDPSGKVQGPFSIVQLRKWNATGYFPVDLRIWKVTEKQDDSILLTDALVGQFQKDKVQAMHNVHPSPSHSGKPQGVAILRGTEVQVGGENWRSQGETNSWTGKVAPMPVEIPKHSSDGWVSTNLPSPTPSQTPLGTTKVQAYESKWSGDPVQSAGSLLGVNRIPGNTEGTQESMMRASNNEFSSSFPVTSPSSKPEKIMPSGSTSDLATHHQPTISAPVLNQASLNTGADIKSVVSNLHSLVQSVASHLPPVETQGWGSASLQKPEMIVSTPTPGSESQPWRGAPSQKMETNNHVRMPAQPGAHGQWRDVPSVNSTVSSFSAGNAGGNFSTTAFQTVPPSDPWRPPVASNQPNIQPPGPPNVSWDMGVVGNQNAAPRMGQESQNPSWGPVAANPNMGWAGPGPGNPNMNWGVPSQGMVPGNTNQGWGAAPGHGSTHGNPVSGWGPPPMNTNANQSWAGHGQGQAPGNANPAWTAPGGNQGNWGSERSHNTDRYGNQRDMGSQGGDSGYGGGKPWNRQSSFGSGGSKPPFKGQRVCKFHESGHCKKGASCDYLHT